MEHAQVRFVQILLVSGNEKTVTNSAFSRFSAMICLFCPFHSLIKPPEPQEITQALGVVKLRTNHLHQEKPSVLCDGCSALEPAPLRVACTTAHGVRTVLWTEEDNHECTAGFIRTMRTQLNTFCENKMLPKLKKIGDNFWNCYITTRQHFLGQTSRN